MDAVLEEKPNGTQTATSLEDLVRQEVAKRRPQGILTKKQRVVALCTPTLGQVSMWWVTAMLDLIWPLNCGKAVLPMVDLNGGDIAEMRNRCVQVMLASENETLEVDGIFWLDDDVIVNRAAIVALLSHDRDISAGVYFSKGEYGEPLIFGGGSAGTQPFLPGEVFEGWGWAQGLCYVRLDVYKRVRDEILDGAVDKFGAPLWYEPGQFKIGDRGELVVGGTEDFPFFEKCEKLGYRPIIDCRREAFGYHYDTVAKQGYPVKQWNMYYRREPVVWPANRHHEEVVWK